MRFLLVAAFILGLTACARSAEPAAVPGAAESQASVSASPEPVEITLAFGGDVQFSERTAPLLDDPDTAFGKIGAVLAKADFALINLETAVTTRGTAEPKDFLFRAPPSAFAAVKAAGVDAVSLANNHALDYGRVGLADTLAAAQQHEVPALGAGLARQAYQPWVTEIKGTRIAVLSLTHINELWQRWMATDEVPGLATLRDPDRAYAAVRAAREQADVVVVIAHWGPEYVECPNGDLERLSAELIDAGADLIVGGHQHLMLGAGWLERPDRSAYVAYGLGNFLWWRNDAMSNDTGVLWATIRDKKLVSAQLIPAYIDRETGQPYPATGEIADRIMQDQVRLRACAGLSEHPAL